MPLDHTVFDLSAIAHPLSRHRAQRNQPEHQERKTHPLQDAPSPPDRTIVPGPAAKPTAVAYLRLVRTIRIRTMIDIIIIHVHDTVSPFT